MPAAAGARALALVDAEVDAALGVLLLPVDQRLVDVLDGRAVEDRGRHVDAAVALVGVGLLVGLGAVVVPAVAGDPPEVGLEDLADVHPARHAERVEDDVDGGAVGEVGHVLLGHDLRDHTLVPVAAGELVALGDLALGRDVDADQVVDAGRQVVAVVAAEGEDVDDDAALAVRDLQRGVADLARLLLEDRADQLLLGGQLGLALRRHLADQQVAGDDLGADADDAALVEVAQALLGAVGDVAGDLLVAELGRAGVDLVLLDVDRGQFVVLDQALGEDDRVLEVVALPGHEGDQAVLAQGDLAAGGRGAVGEHVALLHLLAGVDDRPLVDDRALVGAHELVQRVLVLLRAVGDHDPLGVDVADLAVVLGQDDVAGVDRGAALHAGADQRRVGLQQRHRLALHVGAHQRPVGVVVLEERDQRRRHRPDLGRRDVHQVDFLGSGGRVLLLAGADQDLRAFQFAASSDRPRRSPGRSPCPPPGSRRGGRSPR